MARHRPEQQLAAVHNAEPLAEPWLGFGPGEPGLQQVGGKSSSGLDHEGHFPRLQLERGHPSLEVSS